MNDGELVGGTNGPITATSAIASVVVLILVAIVVALVLLVVGGFLVVVLDLAVSALVPVTRFVVAVADTPACSRWKQERKAQNGSHDCRWDASSKDRSVHRPMPSQ